MKVIFYFCFYQKLNLMTTDQLLLDRIRNIMTAQQIEWTEKRMFGGNCFMVDDKMCFGTYKGGLMARVGPENMEELLLRKGVEQMIHNGRAMKAYVFVQEEAYAEDSELEFWIVKCLEFNPKAKVSKKRKKKPKQ